VGVGVGAYAEPAPVVERRTVIVRERHWKRHRHEWRDDD
jgi:hypothetical protein